MHIMHHHVNREMHDVHFSSRPRSSVLRIRCASVGAWESPALSRAAEGGDMEKSESAPVSRAEFDALKAQVVMLIADYERRHIAVDLHGLAGGGDMSPDRELTENDLRRLRDQAAARKNGSAPIAF